MTHRSWEDTSKFIRSILNGKGSLKKIDNFKYTPVISDEIAKKNWGGEIGLVHNAVISKFPNMRNYSVYSCGAPIMVQSAHKDFVEKCNLPEEQFFSDAFTTAADTAKLK